MAINIFYAIANNVGHSGPSTTLKHYIHSMPYMIAHRLDEFDIAAVAHLLGKTSESLRYHLRTSGRPKIGSQIRKTLLGTPEREHYRGTERQALDYQHRSKCWSNKNSGSAIGAVLKLHWLDLTSVEDIEKSTGIDRSTITQWVQNSEALSILHAKNRSHPAFLMMTHVASGQRVPVPKAPHYRTDRIYAKELFEKLSEVQGCPSDDSLFTAITEAIGHPRFSLLFRDRESARKVIDLLDGANIPRSHLNIRIVHGRVSSGWLKQANAYWKIALPEKLRFSQPYQLSASERVYVDHGALALSIGLPGARRSRAESRERSPGATYALTLFLIQKMETLG